jgi:hypothetical protein
MQSAVEISWDKIIDKKVKSSDKDLGKVESVSTEYIEVKEGLVSKKHYYIPKYYIEGKRGDLEGSSILYPKILYQQL